MLTLMDHLEACPCQQKALPLHQKSNLVIDDPDGSPDVRRGQWRLEIRPLLLALGVDRAQYFVWPDQFPPEVHHR